MYPCSFNFNSKSIRVASDIHGLPLFCLADVCSVLQIKNGTSKRFKLNNRGVHKMYTPTSSGIQSLTFVSEDNLYRIMFRFKKNKVLKFQNWVFKEVLPTIRKTGAYYESARKAAYEELNSLYMQEKVSREKATFHSHGMHRRKYEKHLNEKNIQTCQANIQLTFEGLFI